jgi:hypothetical protein
LAADGPGFSRIAHGECAVFITPLGKQSQKAFIINEISFINAEIVKMNNEEHSESERFITERLKMRDAKLFFFSV